MVKSSWRSWFTIRSTFSKYPITELCLKFDTIYYYNMFDDKYFPNSQRRRRWRDHCFWLSSRREINDIAGRRVHPRRRFRRYIFYFLLPRALDHDHPPPRLQTTICSPQIHITQHPGVPYTGEKLSISVSFLRLGSRARALAAHTHSKRPTTTTEAADGRKEKNITLTYIYI